MSREKRRNEEEAAKLHYIIMGRDIGKRRRKSRGKGNDAHMKRENEDEGQPLLNGSERGKEKIS